MIKQRLHPNAQPSKLNYKPYTQHRFSCHTDKAIIKAEYFLGIYDENNFLIAAVVFFKSFT